MAKKRKPEPYGIVEELCFDEPPRIISRGDALYLLNRMIKAQVMTYFDVALEALRDAIEREAI